MSVLSPELTEVTTGTVVLPRVNLLPPEIAAARVFRRVQMGLGGVLLGALGVAALLYVAAASSVGSAQTELDNATQQKLAVQKQITKFAGVQATYSQAQAARTQLAQAMGDEIRYSRLLNDLGLSIPGNVWLTSMSLTAAAPARASTAAAAVAGPTSVATVSFAGVAYAHDDVATWLESLLGVKGLANPYFSSSSEFKVGPRVLVNYSSTAILTSEMYSLRYSKVG